MKALPKLRNIVPMPAPRAVPGPRIRDRTSAGTAPIGTQNHLAFPGYGVIPLEKAMNWTIIIGSQNTISSRYIGSLNP